MTVGGGALSGRFAVQSSSASTAASRATVPRPLPSQPAKRPSACSVSPCRRSRQASKISTALSSKASTSGFSGVPTARAMRCSAFTASSSRVGFSVRSER